MKSGMKSIDFRQTKQNTTIHYNSTHEPSVNCTAGLSKAQKYSGSEVQITQDIYNYTEIYLCYRQIPFRR